MLNFYRFNHFQKHIHILQGVTLKSREYPYDFSLALHTGENIQDIVDNRMILSDQLSRQRTLHFIVAKQTHSDHIHIIDKEETKGWTSIDNAIEDCDALITNIPYVVLSILTADCVPILLYDKEKQIIAAVHAGWKGTRSSIVLKTVKKMIDTYQSNVKDIIVGIAPSIGVCCYEVGEEVSKYFLDIPNAYIIKENKYMLDLPYINKQQLLDIGIQVENIEMSNICTACEVDRFFSYRKEKRCSGRFMSMIALKGKNED